MGFSKTEKLIDLPCKSTKPKNVLATTNIFCKFEAGYDLNLNDGSLDNHKGDVSQSNSILLPLPVNQMYNIWLFIIMKMGVIVGILDIIDKKQLHQYV